jgi:hypothetical protein
MLRPGFELTGVSLKTMTRQRPAVVVAIVIICCLFLSSGFVRKPTVVSAQGAATPDSAHVWFHEDFSTRANRWRLLDLGKATITFEESTLVLRATPADYALWTFPDTDLKPERYDMKVQVKLNDGDEDARAGMMIGYRADSDMLVLAVSRQGNVYLGRYTFGLWNDVIPPSKVSVEPDQPITLEAILDSGYGLRLFANGQPAGQTTLEDFQASGFGLYAMSGQEGGVDAAFLSFTVSDSQ